MLKSLRVRYKANKAVWDNKDGYVQPMIPYWAFLVLMSAPVVVLGFMIYHVATR